MKKLFYILFFSATATMAYSQEHRYREEIFASVHHKENVVYGYNATYLGLYSPYHEALLQPLIMDIYEPDGDDVGNRPLIIYFHSGNFLPFPANQDVVGTLRDSSVVAFCTKMARCGYVVASADYRLGWNPYDAPDDKRRFGIINAAYRGVQDARTCIRYFRESAEAGGNPYRICQDRIALFGDDTGGYLAVHASALDRYSKILDDAELWIEVDTLTHHFIPMIGEERNGDVEGKTFGINDGLPPFPFGDTLCYPNLMETSSSFRVAVNLAGAVADKDWIEPGQPPIISIATPYDNTTPVKCGDVFIDPGLAFYVINVCGSEAIAQAEEETGNNDVFNNMQDYFVNDFQRSVEEVALSRNNGSNCYLPVIGDTSTDINPWQYWDRISNPIDSMGILDNPHMSKEKAEAYMDTILAYVLPRLWVAMDLGAPPDESCTTATETLLKNAVELEILPNPSNSAMMIHAPSNFTMREIQVFDMKGSLLQRSGDIDDIEYRLNVTQLQPGMYILKIRFDQGITARQIIVQ